MLLECDALEMPVFNIYLLAGILLAAIGLVGVAVSRMRKAPSADQVTPNVLNRIRTEYR